MINKSNDLPSFVNETNLPNIVDKLTDAKNIKISNNKYGNRVQTVVDKIVEKADDITKAIKQEVVNNSYSFKVGTGDVDVSADVEDGFGEVGIKGVTYQNLIIPNSMTKPNNIIIDGDIVTLLDSYNTFEGITYKALTKKNTTYTVVLDVKELFKDGIGYKIQINDGAYLYNEPLKPGINVIKITTKENGDNYHIAILKVSTAVGTMKFSKKILLLEGDHTNNPNLPSYFEGIVGVGDKSKNLLNPNSFKSSTGISMIENQVINIDVPTDGGQRTIFEGLNLPAGTYRVTTKVLEGEYTGGNLLFYNSNGEKFTENRLIGSYTINATNNNINKLLIWAVKGICKIRIQLEKGSSETSYEPYYDGHKIKILSNGKNLINLKDMPSGSLENSGKVVMSPTSNYKVTPNFIKIDPTKKICFYYEYNENDASTPEHNMIAYYDKNFSYIGAVYDLPPKGILKSPPAQACYLRLRVRKEAIKLSLIFESSIVYEPYVSDKTQILLDEPLMRLPNGVCDEITRDSKLIRRVGKAVIDSSSDIRILDEQEMDDTAYCNIYRVFTNEFSRKHHTPMISNIMPYNPLWNCDNEGVNGDHETLSFRVKKSKLSELTSAAFREYLLSKNPVVYYQLAEPIVTELPAPCLRIFKGGHLTFNTLVAPESTHVVQLNKSAQIERSIREVQGLDNRINVLENNYDNLILFTMSRLNDLELNYTLK